MLVVLMKAILEAKSYKFTYGLRVHAIEKGNTHTGLPGKLNTFGSEISSHVAGNLLQPPSVIFGAPELHLKNYCFIKIGG